VHCPCICEEFDSRTIELQGNALQKADENVNKLLVVKVEFEGYEFVQNGVTHYIVSFFC
jgi:hypothetical protein